MNKTIDDEKLRAAKEKLACHIEPPKGSAWAAMLAEQEAGKPLGGEDTAAKRSGSTDSGSGASGASCGSSCGSGAADAAAQGRKIRLTEMTSAGG